MSKEIQIKWLSEPEEKDYPAAQSYLSLFYDNQKVEKLVADLRQAPVLQFKAKDISRASGLSLLGISNTHVEKDRKKITDGKYLSPILLIKDGSNAKVIIADGYHRMCAIYSYDEDAYILCKIV